MSDIKPMDAVAVTNTQRWRDTTPGGFQIFTSGHWEDDQLVEDMHPQGSRELSRLYEDYGQLVKDLEVDPATADSFNDFRARYFNGGAVVRSAPQLQYQPADWKLNTGAAVGAGALAGIGGGMLLKARAGGLAGGIGGAVLAAAAGFGAIKLVDLVRHQRHEGRVEDFQEEFDRQVRDTEVAKLVAFEQRIFDVERDPAREGSVDEKLALLTDAILRHHDSDGDGSVDVDGEGRETPEPRTGGRGGMGAYYVEQSDRDRDGVTSRAELHEALGGYREVLERDDTAVNNVDWLDTNRDGVVDDLRPGNPPGNETSWIHAYWTS